MKKYQVVGGQYYRINYGESDTLKGAMAIARKHEEYWDNHGGWHVPQIYRSEDCEPVTLENGNTMILPKMWAFAAAVFSYMEGKWVKYVDVTRGGII